MALRNVFSAETVSLLLSVRTRRSRVRKALETRAPVLAAGGNCRCPQTHPHNIVFVLPAAHMSSALIEFPLPL